MIIANSPGFEILMCMWPFLFFFAWLWFQMMSPLRHDAPTISTQKIVIRYVVFATLAICLTSVNYFVRPPRVVAFKPTPAVPTLAVLPPEVHPTPPLRMPIERAK